MVNNITEDLEKKILEGILKPGRRIVEAELCKIYGVSQSPVREALRILESQGYVIHEPRKGVSVTQITANDIEEIYHIRAYLESLATHLAVKRQNPKVIEKLEELHKKMIKAEAEGNVITYFNLNLRFHEILVNACKSERIIQMIQTFVKQTKRYRIDVLKIPGMMKKSIESHAQIIETFKAGDAEKAEQVRKRSILKNISLYLDRYFLK